MQIKVLEKIGQQNLHFYTSNIPMSDFSLLSVHPHAVSAGDIESSIQNQIDKAVEEKKKIAIFPEGPYCAPIFSAPQI